MKLYFLWIPDWKVPARAAEPLRVPPTGATWHILWSLLFGFVGPDSPRVILMWAWRRPFMVWRSGKCVARRIIPTYCYCNDEGTPSLVFSSPAILLAPVKAANVEAAERSSSMTFPCSVCMVTEVRTWSEMWCCFEGRNLALTSRLVLMERTLLNFIFACLIFLKLYQATALSGPH